MRSAFFVAALLLAGCATAPVRVTGRDASRLSEGDVRQIAALAASRGSGYPVREIVVMGPDRARVITRRADGPKSWSGSNYFVVRRGTAWTVDDTVGAEATVETIVTSH